MGMVFFTKTLSCLEFIVLRNLNRTLIWIIKRDLFYFKKQTQDIGTGNKINSASISVV